MKEIYLIRHTTPEVEKGVCYGQTDLNLKNTFPQEAKRIKEITPNTIHQGVFPSLKYNQKAKQPNISKKAAKKNIPKLPIIYFIFLLSFLKFS